ncbi:XP_036371117.1uncharacterized protein LOC118768539 [Octopus vulgaris]|uniref:XP_036371117.1uncharacterized protein LOC118768539 n=1 Tax=Octopus vulgaris TaxID=6645 RepID=A0AA36FKL2_OCTVU|nr:XP_036371117.1uncharacterized protein LOC118768539 [Octopus vulgaris]
MVPAVLLSNTKPLLNLCGGCSDEMFVYLVDGSRMFAINDNNLVVRDHVTNNQLNMYIDLVDVLSRNICVAEMLSSRIYLQDLTVSDKAQRDLVVHPDFEDEQPVGIDRLVITENNLIAGYDRNNKNIKILTFDGQLLDSVELNGYYVNMSRWQSNTLVITTYDNLKLLTLKVEFPLSLITYQTINEYKCIAPLSDNLLVCSRWRDGRTLYVVDIDERHSTVKEVKQIDIIETLLTRDRHGDCNYIFDIGDIAVTANDIIIVYNDRFIIFFNRNGHCLHSVRHYMEYIKDYNNMTIDDSYLYIYGW